MRYILAITAFFVLFSKPVYAQEPAATFDQFVEVIRRIIGLLAPIAAIAVFVMMVYGGFKFIRSRGDPKNVEEARNILQYAIIGAALVAGSWLLLQLIGNITQVDVTTVTLPTPEPTP